MTLDMVQIWSNRFKSVTWLVKWFLSTHWIKKIKNGFKSPSIWEVPGKVPLTWVEISENLENEPHCKIRKMVKIYFSRSVGQRNHHFIKNRFTILIFKNFMPIMVSTFIIFDILKLGSKIDFGKIDFENSSSKFFPA